MGTSVLLTALIWEPASAALLQRTCEERLVGLPAVVPEMLVLSIKNEKGSRIDAAHVPRVQEELRTALSFYSFSASVILMFDDEQLPSPTVHVVDYHLWLDRSIPSSQPWTTVHGRMCGNGIIVRETSDPMFNAWTHKHELGHYFGLPHLSKTYMNDDGDRTPEHDIRVECQEHILERWKPGANYTAHWVYNDRHECIDL